MEEDKILDFILKSKWYDYRKTVKNQQLNIYGMEMEGSLLDEVGVARAFLNGHPLQQYTIFKLDLDKLLKEFLNQNVKYKLEPIKEPYQTREQMVSGYE